jgi:hypothetical protein
MDGMTDEKSEADDLNPGNIRAENSISMWYFSF